MAIHKLKPKFVETVRSKGMYPDGGGLYLQVKGEAKSWLFRYNVAGRGDRQMGLGPLHTIGLAQARELARQAREKRLNGIDPIEARNAERLDQKLAASKNVTFRQCAEGWMNSQDIGWGAEYAHKVARMFAKYVYPRLGNMPVQKIDVDLVHSVLKPIHEPQPSTYLQVQMYIEGAFAWAKAMGAVSGDNPASVGKASPLGLLLAPVSKFHVVKSHASLPWKQVGEFMALLRAHDTASTGKNLHTGHCKVCNSPYLAEIEAADHLSARAAESKFGIRHGNIFRHRKWRREGKVGHPTTMTMAAHALEFLILTAVRREQAASVRWDAIDLEDKVWICPPESHKAGKKTGQSHIVPLSDAAMAVLHRMKEIQAGGNESEYVFPAWRSNGKVFSGRPIAREYLNLLLSSFVSQSEAVQKAIADGKFNSCNDEDGKVWIKGEDGGRITVHGFRTTFKGWSLEYGYPETDSEMALAHTVGNTVRNIYARHAARIEPRRVMMNDWANNYCGVVGPQSAKVLTLRQAKNGDPA